MAKGSIFRWVKGLIPTILIVGICMVLGFFAYISFVGVPSFAKNKIERAIASEGFPVSIANLKVNVWPEFKVIATNVDLYRSLSDKELDESQKNSLIEVSKLEMIFSVSELFNGKLKLKQIHLGDTDIQSPTKENDHRRLLLLDDLQGQISLADDGMIALKGCTAMVQGIQVFIGGKFALPQSDQSSKESFTIGDVESALSQVQTGVDYLKKLSWGESDHPVLRVDLTEDIDNDGIDVSVKFEADYLKYGRFALADIMVEGRYSNNVIGIKKFTCKDPKLKGKFDLIGRCNLSKREISWDVKSSAPVISWVMTILDDRFMPEYIKLHSIPQFKCGGKMVMNESWDQVDSLTSIGSFSMGEFDVYGTKFVKARADFSYKNGDLFLYDINIRQFGSSFTGQVISKGNDVKLELQSNLPVNTWIGLAKTITGDSSLIPSDLVIDGKPKINATGHLVWEGKPFHSDVRVDTVTMQVDIDQIAYKDLSFASVKGDVLLIGSSVNIRNFIATGNQGYADIEASIMADSTVFRIKTDVPPQLLLAAANYEDILPEGLVLPTKAKMEVKGQIETATPGKIEPKLIRAEMISEEFSYHQVPISSANLNIEYRPGEIFIKNCQFDLPDGKIDLFLKGYLEGQVFMMGQSSLPLPIIDRLLNNKEIDFFMKRFAFNPKSSLDVSWQGTLGLYNIEKAYEVELDAKMTNTKYSGVNIKDASLRATLISNQLTANNIKLLIDNSDYINNNNLGRAPVETTLNAEKIIFRFDRDTVEVLNMTGDAYPSYFMKMASPSAAETLSEFVFTRPVKLSGGGLFPMEDDFSMMKGRIRYDASLGTVRYKMLGTTLHLGNSKGEVLVNPEWLVLNKMTGTVWGGTYEGHISAQIDKGTAVTGSMNLKGMDFVQIGKSYDSVFPKAQVFGAIDFNYPGGNLNGLQAKGEVAITNGNLIDLPLFGALGKGLGAVIPGFNYLMNFSIDQADCDFSIANGLIKTGNFNATGSNMSLYGNGWIRLSDMQTGADLKLRLGGLPGLVTSPLFILAGGLFQVTGSGKLSDVSWSFAPFSGGQAPPPPAPKKISR